MANKGIMGFSWPVVVAAALVITFALGFWAIGVSDTDTSAISGGISIPGISPVAEEGVSVSLPFQTTMVNPFNASRYGGTNAKLDVIGSCTAAPATAGVAVPIDESNAYIAESCDLSRAAEGTITCSTSGSNLCTSSGAYRTGETLVLHATTTEKDGAYGRLFAVTFDNSMVTENSNGARIFDIRPLEVFDRIDVDHMKFAIVSDAGQIITAEADGDTMCQTTAGCTAHVPDADTNNNYTATTSEFKFELRVRSTGATSAGKSACYGVPEPELINRGGVPELRFTKPVAVISFTASVDDSDLIADGWTKMEAGYPDANVTFWQELPQLCVDSVATNLRMSVPITIDTNRISASTTFYVNLWVADLQAVDDIRQGAGSSDNTERFAFSVQHGFANPATALGKFYTTTSGNQLSGSMLGVGKITTSS